MLHADTQNALVRALIAKRQRDEVCIPVFPPITAQTNCLLLILAAFGLVPARDGSSDLKKRSEAHVRRRGIPGTLVRPSLCRCSRAASGRAIPRARNSRERLNPCTQPAKSMHDSRSG